VIDELPTDRDRQLLFRFYIAEDDKERICADLGLTSLHFNRVLHRARERYKELYESRGKRQSDSSSR
jgi:RNA polymerase sigma-70 factor (ECF subfamily)